MRFQNQLHQPRKKTKTVDKLGNQRRRTWFKCGNSTMLFTECTPEAAKCLNRSLKELLQAYGCKLEGTFIVTK